ncbi:hypothetical protein EV356DRAFT_504929 [Viridothelium virens]|uniref:Uncharacterized protein n=1 Tax=Viridothelium virens TaxID=1048519 RepID=A0A6A6H456_VIRVR|nr:hypothetical protein EV356DRAFT_504929 [Viridothelium virens]
MRTPIVEHAEGFEGGRRRKEKRLSENRGLHYIILLSFISVSVLNPSGSAFQFESHSYTQSLI